MTAQDSPQRRPELRVPTTSEPLNPEGFLRLVHIIGAPRRGIPPIVPVARSTWWAGVKCGRYPAPIKHGGTTLWRVRDIIALCRRIAESEEDAA
jgi:hypothetical protein